MARLARVHFAGLGTDSARFNPVTLDFRDQHGKAGHAVMWLRNGGGKTTMLSFLYSTLRPHANDWLGKHNGRQTDLLEYVKERQTGFVFLEFEFPQVGVRRIIGQAISKRSAREPKRAFFTFRADGPLAWDKIPATGLGDPAGSIELFLERVNAFGQNNGGELEFYHTDRQGEWRTHLDSIGLDPEIYHTHLLMNADEGGLLNFFDFQSAETFVEKLLDMAFETLRPLEEPGEKPDKEDLTTLIEKFRQKVFGRPNLDATAIFCQHALSALEALKTELDVATQFRQQRDIYRGQAARFLVSTDKHLAALRIEVELLTGEKEISARAKRDALTRRDEHRKFQKHYDRRRRLLVITEAAEALTKAEQERTREENWLAALRTAHRRRRMIDCDRLIADFSRQKQEREQSHEPDRKALERFGRSLYDLLSQRIFETKRRCEKLGQERALAATEHGDLQRELVKLTGDVATAKSELGSVRTFLNDVDNERRRLREQGLLLPPAETGSEALKRWQAKALSHLDNSVRLGIEIGVAETRVSALRAQEREKQQQRGGITGDIGRLTTWMGTMDSSAARLRIEPMIVREIGENANADLYNPSLDAALARFADDCQRSLLAKTVEGAADRRIVEHCKDHPNSTFPAPVGIEQVIEKLRTAGVTSAIPAYRWLSENCEAGEAARRLLAQPALYSGIVVQVPAQVDAARSVIVADGLDLPVLVGTPANFAQIGAPEMHHVVLPEEKGFFNAALAQINLARVANHASRREAEIGQLSADRKSTEGVLARLREHVRNYPAKSVDEKRRELATQEHLLVAHDAALAELAREISSVGDRLEDLRGKKGEQEKNAGEAREQATRVQSFVNTYESKVAGRREEEKALIDTIQTLGTRQSEISGRLLVLAELLPQFDSQIGGARLDQQGFAFRQEAVPPQFIGPDPATDAGDDLKTLTEAFDAKRRDYEGRVQAGYFDAKVEEQQERKSEIEAEQRRDTAQPSGSDVEIALGEADLGKAVEDQNACVSRAAVEVSTARRTLDNAQRDQPPPLLQSERDTPHPDFGKPETATQAAEFAQRCDLLSQEFDAKATEADANLAAVSERLNLRSQAVERYDNLPARLRRVVGEPVPPAEPSGEFQGSDAPDRIYVATLETNFDSCLSDLKAAQDRAGGIYADQYLEVFKLRDLEGRTIDLVEKMRRLPRSQVEERIAFWIEEIRTHAQVVADELAGFDKDRRTVLGLMNDCVRDAEIVLRAAEARSRMPDSMGAWAGHSFLRISVPRRNDQAERMVLLDRMLADWIDIKNPKPIPAGAKLAYHCLIAVSGKGQIEVKILKPEYNLRPFQHDIVKLKSFSGGEQVTAAIILYCIIVKLRSQRRGRAADLAEDSGFLLLDNPLGKANLPDFVDLQISMADRMGVQYICGTGINDFEALAGFPKVIRLRNSSINPRTGANIVEVEGQDTATLGAVSFGTNGHGKA